MERITLYAFWTAMLCCAGTVITIVWFGEDRLPEFVFRIAATFFVFGLANFLLWLPLITYRFLQR